MRSLPFFRAVGLRSIEAAAVGLPLMQRAGFAAAELASTIVADRGAAILVLAGPGNNGGDAFVAATLLGQRFFDVRVVFAGAADRLPPDAAAAHQRFVDAGGTTLAAIPEQPRWSLIVDGLFGIGLTRAVAEPYAGLIAQANALAARDACPLLALDCPSGLDADTGTRRGATIVASHTITFIGAKPGLFTGDGPDCCGEISIATLDLDAPAPAAHAGRTVGHDLFAEHLKQRARNSHKGSFGTAGIIGGAPGMVGGALLAARAALRLGSGRVRLGLLDARAPTFDAGQPELMLNTPQFVLDNELSALACGPGLGRSEEARQLLETACARGIVLLLDADALNLLAVEGELQLTLATREAPTLLTPHPAEAARLLDSSVAAVEADRLATASELASHYRAWVALKGCGTVIATPAGELYLNTTGNPGLATAGSGDVLSGIVTALLAQGWPPLEALLAGVHLHGAAADALVAQGCGPHGLTAGELIDSARACLNQWITASGER
jgi:hydroxyethylthiazole kinase-like uncharacterized protein yjeF